MELQARKFASASCSTPIDFGSEEWKTSGSPATIARSDFIQSCLTREEARLFLVELSPRILELQSPENLKTIEEALTEFLKDYS
jgi:hypothetical protein